ncbi:TadE family type IV pilus minor pilin [Yinghuangia soli]|uniref:Pilus assembly protein n=1 Tax=Yinghuangia soli TaxID=2908204 RepID=A0AA41U312_9ACTN|nr:TadE family type IV pilus minor pilin [Yinghuangia soli]MCF2529232.1 pilus assembly protein [Yinghuangia soli]
MRRSDRGTRKTRWSWLTRRGSDAGYVTAETAVVLPALVLLVLGLVAGIAAAAAQIRCVDAAQAGARAVARGESVDAANSAAHGLAPREAQFDAVVRDGTVRFRVTAGIPLPGPWRELRIPVEHKAVVAMEPAGP